jgi:chemotaxis protein CheD
MQMTWRRTLGVRIWHKSSGNFSTNSSEPRKGTRVLKINVGVADMKVSNDPDVTLVTHSLGSCIGLAVYDPAVRVGGILHYMLPESELDTNKARKNPLMFADTGIPILFRSCYKLGAMKGRMIVKVAGGSQIMDASGVFNIGKRNYAALRKILWRNHVLIDAEDIGGTVNRTMWLNVATGELSLKISGKVYKVL